MEYPKCESCNSIVKIIQINCEDNIYICEKCLKGLNKKSIKKANTNYVDK